MDLSTIEKLFNIHQFKDVYSITISQANHSSIPKNSVLVHIDSKQSDHVLKAIKEIIPDLTFEFDEPYLKDNGHKMGQWCNAETKDIEVTVFTSWEKEKAPTSDGSRKENIHLDNTTDENDGQYEADHIESWTPEQILRNEG